MTTRYIEATDGNLATDINEAFMSRERARLGRGAGESIDRLYRRGRFVGFSPVPITTGLVKPIRDGGAGELVPVDAEVERLSGTRAPSGRTIDTSAAKDEAQLSRRWRDALAATRTTVADTKVRT